jgi:hypothetical protein
VLLLSGGSLRAAQYALTLLPEFAFFSLQTRTFALIAGALLAAQGLHGTAARGHTWLAQGASSSGTASLTISVVWLENSFARQGL